MKKYAQYMDFLDEVSIPSCTYRAIIWYFEDWIKRRDKVTVDISKSSAYDGYFVEVTTDYESWWNVERINMYEENGNFIFEKTSYGKEKTEDSEWYSNLAPLTVSIPVKSSGYRVFAKFIKEYYETHKAQQG